MTFLMNEIAQEDDVQYFRKYFRDPSGSYVALKSCWEVAVKHSAHKIIQRLVNHPHSIYLWKDLWNSKKWREIKFFLHAMTHIGQHGMDRLTMFMPLEVIQYLLTLGADVRGDLLPEGSEDLRYLFLTTGNYPPSGMTPPEMHFLQIVVTVPCELLHTRISEPTTSRVLLLYDLVVRRK
jgi:hypothetical protein